MNSKALLIAAKKALKMWDKDGVFSSFDWGKSCLRAEDIRVLNELPAELRKAIEEAERMQQGRGGKAT